MDKTLPNMLIGLCLLLMLIGSDSSIYLLDNSEEAILKLHNLYLQERLIVLFSQPAKLNSDHQKLYAQ